jgi:GT2 family glycosyltransferase
VTNGVPERVAPSVAVLTVNTDGAAFMAEFAESLSTISYPNFQLVLVDNASTDRSLEILRRFQPDAVVLQNDANLGFTGACNRGIEYCLWQGFDYILFLNGDVLVEPDFLDRLVAASDGKTMTAPKTYLYHHPGTLDDSVGQFDWSRGTWKHGILGTVPTDEFDQQRQVDTANLSCLLVPSAALREVGLLDNNFFIYYDDTDFVRRAHDVGYQLWFVPESVIHHRKGATIGGSETAFGLYYLTRNRPYLIRKHVRSPLQRAFFWTYFVGSRLTRVVSLTLSGRRDLASAILAGMRDYWRGRMGKTMERGHPSDLDEVASPGLRLSEGTSPKV